MSSSSKSKGKSADLRTREANTKNKEGNKTVQKTPPKVPLTLDLSSIVTTAESKPSSSFDDGITTLPRSKHHVEKQAKRQASTQEHDIPTMDELVPEELSSKHYFDTVRNIVTSSIHQSQALAVENALLRSQIAQASDARNRSEKILSEARALMDKVFSKGTEDISGDDEIRSISFRAVDGSNEVAEDEMAVSPGGEYTLPTKHDQKKFYEVLIDKQASLSLDTNNKIPSELADLRSHIHQLEAKVTDMLSENPSLPSQNSTLEAADQELRTSHEQVLGEKRALLDEKAILELQNQKMHLEIKSLSSHNQRLEIMVTNLEAANKNLEASSEKLQDALDNAMDLVDRFCGASGAVDADD